jgi:branched-chain amino acid transport system substrate-binding protein
MLATPRGCAPREQNRSAGLANRPTLFDAQGRGVNRPAFVFRVCFIDPFQGAVMARFARERLALGRIAVLEQRGNGYSEGLAQAFASGFEQLGGQVARRESFAAGAGDFREALERISATEPEALYLPGYYSDVARIARQARAMGLAMPLLGGDGWSSEELVALGGEAVEGGYYSDHYSAQDPSPRVQRFVAAYRAAHGEPPDSAAALGYDALRVAADALARAARPGGLALREALEQTRELEGVTGTLSIDGRHNATKPAVVLRLVRGRPVFQAAIAPD